MIVLLIPSCKQIAGDLGMLYAIAGIAFRIKVY